MQKKINTDKAPGALGPYSQAVEIDQLVYTSGQLGIDPATGELADGVEAQAKQALENVKAILAEVGLEMSSIIKTLVFINDMIDFGVRHLFSRAEETVARVADNDVHLPLKKGMIDKRVDVLHLGQIQAFCLERPGILLKKICDLATVTHGSDDPVAPCEKLSGHSFAEAAAPFEFQHPYQKVLLLKNYSLIDNP